MSSTQFNKGPSYGLSAEVKNRRGRRTLGPVQEPPGPPAPPEQRAWRPGAEAPLFSLTSGGGMSPGTPEAPANLGEQPAPTGHLGRCPYSWLLQGNLPLHALRALALPVPTATCPGGTPGPTDWRENSCFSALSPCKPSDQLLVKKGDRGLGQQRPEPGSRARGSQLLLQGAICTLHSQSPPCSGVGTLLPPAHGRLRVPVSLGTSETSFQLPRATQPASGRAKTGTQYLLGLRK
ncbi:hypothetical protein H8959_017194 [Pygathrix nigripes]